eukprot:15162653-Alexandrium_andersonii.AAC.1
MSAGEARKGPGLLAPWSAQVAVSHLLAAAQSAGEARTGPGLLAPRQAQVAAWQNWHTCGQTAGS